MSGFSASWLALREPVDHRSRSSAVRDRVVAALSRTPTPHILDLGCGSGSNLRALAPSLGGRQRWKLVDNDPELLLAARAALVAWADHSRHLADDAVTLEKDGKSIEVVFRLGDLLVDIEALLDEGADLVTAAALFDLGGVDWVHRFCDLLARRRSPLYAALTYNGHERWTPAHPADASMLAAFNAHQVGDKGLGAAAGPAAADIMIATLGDRGWTIVSGDSPWMLGREDAALIAELTEGSAAAIVETALVDRAVVADWLRAHRTATGCVVGHVDFFAMPGPETA